jgi:AcrR family transcriptional regulator
VPSRRRPRLSDQETRQRMLDTALAMVERDGLTVGLDHISVEEVIQRAGVSRAAVYRRWPYKDLFHADLLRELARGAAPAAAVDEEETRRLLGSVLAARPGDLGTPEGRHRLVVEMLRVSAAREFEAIHRSAAWRTYLALEATFLGLPGGELRAEVGEALRASEERFAERVARGWEEVATALGYRPRPAAGGSFPLIGTLACAAMRGLALMALPDPGLPDREVTADPAGAGPAGWSLIGLSAASIAVTFLEPDPGVTWDDRRTAAVLARFSG